MADPPTRPKDVRLVDPDSNEWPCVLTYAGIRYGMHEWIAGSPVVPTDWHGWKARVGLLPAKSSVTFTEQEDNDG